MNIHRIGSFFLCVFGVTVLGCATEHQFLEGTSNEEVDSATSTTTPMGDADDVALIPIEDTKTLHEAGIVITPIRGTIAGVIPESLWESSAIDDKDDAFESEAVVAHQSQDAVVMYNGGEFGYNGGTWGKSYDVVVSQYCAGRLRDSAQAYAYANNGGYCNFKQWYSNDLSDCRFIVHVGAPAFKHGTCAWSVYANEIAYASYNALNTNSAQQNTTKIQIALNAGQTLTAGTCGLPGASASGDTYLRLFKGGTEVAGNDNACGGYSSSLMFTAPSAATYELRAGCYGSGSCGGTVAWVK